MMALNQVFDKILWINSKKRVDRFKNMTKRLAGVNAERFNAIHGGDIDHRTLSFGNPIKQLDNGEIGCFLSHRKIYELAKKNGWGKTLILEDDALFCSNFEQIFSALYQKVPDYDMLYLGQWNYDHLENGGNSVGGKTYALKKKITEGIYRADRCWLTHAYAIDYKCLDYLLENTKELYSSIDNVLANIQKGLDVYAFHPNLITQDGTKSSLRLNNR